MTQKYFALLDGKEVRMCTDCAEHFLATGDLIHIGFTVSAGEAYPLLIMGPKANFEDMKQRAKVRHT